MMRFHAEIVIDAPKDAVWAILTDLTRWTEWNSTVLEIAGEAREGTKVTLRAEAAPKRPFVLDVREVDTEGRMVWTSGMPLGLFRGTRTYLLHSMTHGATHFTMTENFEGLLSPLITRAIPDLSPSFEQFARDLKTAAETR